jgi:hypothetical protein
VYRLVSVVEPFFFKRVISRNVKIKLPATAATTISTGSVSQGVLLLVGELGLSEGLELGEREEL